MFSSDDKVYCVLHSVDNGLSSTRLVYYMYLYQLAGLDFNFRYSISTRGIKCKGLDEHISNMINYDLICLEDGEIKRTELGYFSYIEFPLLLSEWDFIEKFKAELDSLSDDDLYFIVLANILVENVQTKYGVEGLITRKSDIVASLTALTRDYDDTKLNYAIKFGRTYKERLKNV